MEKVKNQEICNQIIKVLKENEYLKLLGIEITSLSKGYCKGKMSVSENIKNPYGSLHGGSLYSLADIIGGTAACTYGNYVTTVSGSMNFLLPAVGMDHVICEAKKVRQGRHLAVYDMILTDDENHILENASFTFYVTDEKVLKD